MRFDKGDFKVLCQGKDDVSGDFIDMIADPFRVHGIVVVGEFDQDGGGAGARDLAERGGRPDGNIVGVGIEGFQAGNNGLSNLFAAQGIGIIINIRAAKLTRQIDGRSVGM